jgi:hypothetical protein
MLTNYICEHVLQGYLKVAFMLFPNKFWEQ